MGTDVGLALLEVGVGTQGRGRSRHAAIAERSAPPFYRGKHARRSVGGDGNPVKRLLRSIRDTWTDLKKAFVNMMALGRWHAIWFTAFSLAGSVEIITGSISAPFGNRNGLALAATGVLMWVLGIAVFLHFLVKHPLPPDGGNR